MISTGEEGFPRNKYIGTYILSYSPQNIKNSQFISCKREGSNGGAISCSSSLYLNNCYFYKCSAEYGGAVYGEEQMFIQLCTVSTCEAKQSSIYCRSSMTISMECSIIESCTAQDQTAFFFFKGSYGTIRELNTTNNKAIHSASGELGDTIALSFFNIHSNSISTNMNAGFGIWGLKTFNIVNNIFSNLSVLNQESSVVALWVDASDAIGTIDKCTFLHCNQNAPIIGIKECNHIIISNVIFDSITVPLNYERVSQTNIQVLENYQFETSLIAGFSDAFYEVSKSISMTPSEDAKQQVINEYYIFYFSIAVGMIISVVIEFFLRKQKLPAAFRSAYIRSA